MIEICLTCLRLLRLGWVSLRNLNTSDTARYSSFELRNCFFFNSNGNLENRTYTSLTRDYTNRDEWMALLHHLALV